MAAAPAACGPGDAHARARAADARYRTGAFTWLVDHEPARVVVWRIPAAIVADLIPDAHVLSVRAAGAGAPCAQARAAHAALFLVAPRSAGALRDAAEDCGFALFRDAGALVIAPLGR